MSHPEPPVPAEAAAPGPGGVAAADGPDDAAPGTAQGRPSPLFLAGLTLAAVGLNAALMATSILTLSLKSSVIAPDRASTVLSIAVGVGGAVGCVGYPALGALSDRCTARLGRRRPFLLAAAVLVALGAVFTVLANSVLTLTLANVVTWLGVVSGLVAAFAVVPERIAPEFRGGPSAVMGLATPAGAVVGLFLAQLVSPNLTAMILLPALPAVVGCLLLVAAGPDAPAPAAGPSEGPGGVRGAVDAFWVSPVRHPGFAWAVAGRLLVFLGVSAVNAYQAFYLIMKLGISSEDVASKIFLATLLLTVMSLVFAPLAGKISDATGHRKPFVVGSALVFAVSLVMVARAGSFTSFLVAIAVMGIGQGVFFSTNFSLFTMVLPDPENPAKDLGIMNLSSNLPSSLVPAVAPTLLAIGVAQGDQNFTLLFLAGAAAALLGALAVLPIRGVR